MIDYHATQLTRSVCAGRNCACASCAMAIYGGTAGATRISADTVRARSRVSCVPGVDTPSGGLYISHVEHVAASFGVWIDYGPGEGLHRWPISEARARMSGPYGGVILGDYDQLGAYAASRFTGDHSAYVHDYRPSDDTYCWHDPLRSRPLRLPARVLLAYWQKPGGAVRGLAGWVRLPVQYRVRFAWRATVRFYTLAGSGATERITGWQVIRRPAYAPSSAPCEAPRHLAYGSSIVQTVRVTAGTYAGRTIAANTDGVTITEG